MLRYQNNGFLVSGHTMANKNRSHLHALLSGLPKVKRWEVQDLFCEAAIFLSEKPRAMVRLRHSKGNYLMFGS